MKQNSTQIEFFKQRDFGEKISATFEFVTHNFKEIITQMVIKVLPIIAIIVAIPAFFPEYFISNFIAIDNISPSAPFVMLLYGIGYFVAAIFAQSIILNILYMKSLAPESQELKDFDLKYEINSNFWKIVGTSLLVSLICIGFTLLLVIPGIIVGTMLCFTTTVAVFEKISPGKAVSRCWNFGLTNWWSTFGLLIVIGIIGGVLNGICSIPDTVLNVAVVFLSQGGTDFHGPVFSIVYYIFHTISIFGAIVFSTLTVIAMAFQYGHIRDKIENISINKQITDFDNL
jgi:hypothetical protein